MIIIQTKLEHPVDKHSQELLSVNIELMLDYCPRFYDRQFYTREKVNSDILSKFEQYLNDYFRKGEAQANRLPSVKYFADKVFLSPGYFGDLVKKETGKTAQEYIQNKIIDLSKEYIHGTQQGVSQIAYSLGFQYSQHFCRLLKNRQAVLPRSIGIRPEYSVNLRPGITEKELANVLQFIEKRAIKARYTYLYIISYFRFGKAVAMYEKNGYTHIDHTIDQSGLYESTPFHLIKELREILRK